MPKTGLPIGEVARGAGVSVHTIRYYEKRRLLPCAPRSEGGYRLFAIEAIDQVRFIKQAQDLGFSLDEIRMLIAGGGADECRRTRDLLRSKLAETDQRMKELRDFNKTLRRHLRACEDQLAGRGQDSSCPVLHAISQAAKRSTKR